MSKLILVSSSFKKKLILEKAGYVVYRNYIVKIDETPNKKEKPEHFAHRVSNNKCILVSKRHPTNAIISTKQIICDGKNILNTKKSPPEHITRAQKINIVTSICIIYMNQNISKIIQTKTKLKIQKTKRLISKGNFTNMSIYSATTIDNYGSTTNMIGLPINQICKILKSIGIKKFE